ncbi:MAG: fumarate reductase/succinate dehydrogenase flavoprotein subunit [Chloroflexota bacterium]|nr:fumarate reductase/succinate dehydrogenase flavoprotein subunit [Chloroflexota bacterium]
MSVQPRAEHDERTYDVIVIGGGGAGLRAAIEATSQGAKTAVVCKSLFGKAHTVMAEGGMAAALRNVWPEDGWDVHFRDTMRGGKLLGNWRMAQIHAQESPDRVLELEEWGAMFDRTPDGLILQRDFGGHRYARLAHVGDRTGLELIRTLQYRAIELGIDVLMECNIQRLLMDDGHVAGAFGYWRQTGRYILLRAKAIVLATGGAGRSWRVTTNSWESTGDGLRLALEAGAELMDIEFVQFHPTGMVWPLSVRGLLVTEGVRGDGGTLKNKDGERFMFRYIPEFFKAETADNAAEADRWYEDKKNNRRTPDLLPRDEVARAINSEVKAGRGTPHGGVWLDIASRRSADYIKRRLPSMYVQFKELADVDITKEAFEIGPTCHYFMGGIRVDADSTATTVRGLFAAGECAAGLHGANRLGGNSLSDLVVFGRRAGLHAAQFAAAQRAPGAVDPTELDAAVARMRAPLERQGGEDPYAIQSDLQDTMQDLVGLIRTQSELDEALVRIRSYRERLSRVSAPGAARYNPGWNLALDLESMLTVSEAVTRAASLRKESRGGHTRDDFPKADPEWAKVNVVVRRTDGELALQTEPLPQMPAELSEIVTGEGKATAAAAPHTT